MSLLLQSCVTGSQGAWYVMAGFQPRPPWHHPALALTSALPIRGDYREDVGTCVVNTGVEMQIMSAHRLALRRSEFARYPPKPFSVLFQMGIVFLVGVTNISSELVMHNLNGVVLRHAVPPA